MPKSLLNNSLVTQEDAVDTLKQVLSKKQDKVISRASLYSAMYPLTRKAIKNLNALLNSKDQNIRLRAIQIVLAKTLPDLKSTENKTEVTERHGVVILPQETIIPLETQLDNAGIQQVKELQAAKDKVRLIKLPQGQTIKHNPDTLLDKVKPQV